MIQDPEMSGEGTHPYSVLAPAGVTPTLSHGAMQDVSFDLMAAGLMTPQAQQAWNELRRPESRLLADLFLYDVDLAEETAEARHLLDSPDAGPRDTIPPAEPDAESLLPELTDTDADEGVAPPPSARSLIRFDR